MVIPFLAVDRNYVICEMRMTGNNHIPYTSGDHPPPAVFLWPFSSAFSPFFSSYIYIYIFFFFFFSLPRPSAGKRKWKLYYSASLDTFILFTFLVGVISRAERVKIGFGRVCENTDTSGMADEVETSIAEILHGPWGYTGRPRED